MYKPEFQGVFRADGCAMAAADALRAVRTLRDVNAHAARFRTRAAFCTLFFVHLQMIQGYRVTQSVQRAQRAEVLAEGPVVHRGKKQDEEQDPHLPAEQKAQRRPERRR